MRNRTITAEADTPEGVDEIGHRHLLDMDDGEEARDVVPGSVTGETVPKRLREFAERADRLAGAADHKLLGLVPVLKTLLRDGFRPVVFCRFIETAEYLGAELRKRLRRPKAEVLVTTGLLPPAERQTRVAELQQHKRAVLVTTDCLSEGINLQDHCNAVVHYDLPWNPTRLEQREGRVDRFGQRHPQVRMVTYWGEDNLIDESVLEVLLKKHKAIRGALGISIPVPGATSTVIEALTENVLLNADMPNQKRFEWINSVLRPETEALELQWEQARQAETKRRSLFAQHTINPDRVADELEAMRKALGSGTDVERFTTTVLTSYGAIPQAATNGADLTIDLTPLDQTVRDALNTDSDTVAVKFSPPAGGGTVEWSRTHPSVGGLAGHVLDCALDPVLAGEQHLTARCGVMRTDQVTERTALLLCRTRMTITTSGRRQSHAVAEETLLAGFVGPPDNPQWLTAEETEALLQATPSGNVGPAPAKFFINQVLGAEDRWRPHVQKLADDQATQLAAAHNRVRTADRRASGQMRTATTRGTGRAIVNAQQPTDILGLYVLLPTIR